MAYLMSAYCDHRLQANLKGGSDYSQMLFKMRISVGEGEGCYPGSWGACLVAFSSLFFTRRRGGEHMEASYLLKQQ